MINIISFSPKVQQSSTDLDSHFESNHDINHLPTFNNNIQTDIFDNLCRITGLKLCHLNVASLYAKIDEIRDIISRTDIHVLSFNESYLDQTITDDEIALHNFNVFRNDRNRHGGGVALYAHINLSPSLLVTDYNV